MKPHILLRIASIIGLLFAVGHTMGAPWIPAQGAQEMALIESMKSLHFNTMGANRSYWDFYFGFGVSISVYLLAQAIILWQVAGVASAEPKKSRPIMLTLFASYLINGAIIWKFFFIAPLVLSAAACICILLAWVSAGREIGTGIAESIAT